MNATIEHINEVGSAFVEFAVPMLIQSGVLILILLLVDLLLRKRVRAVFRYWMWMLVLVKLVLPTSLSSPISVGRWFGDELAYVDRTPEPMPQPKAAVAPAARVEAQMPIVPSPPVADGANPEAIRSRPAFVPAGQPARRIGPAPRHVEPASAAPEREPAVPPSSPATSLSWQGVTMLIWLVVLGALLLWLLQRAFSVRRLVARAAAADGRMTDLLVDCRKRMAVQIQVGLRMSTEAASPAVCGLFTPVILVPKKLMPSLNPSELRVVLLHELAHIKRRDLWVNFTQTVLQIFYFYNPLLWLANVMIRRAREQAVDEMVLVAMGEQARQYPATLVNVAKLALKRPALSLRMIGVVESKSALTGRIRHILGRPMPKTAKLGILGLLVVVAAAVVLLPMAKTVKPQPSVVNNGPLDIRLVAVRPDGGDQLYDASGRKLETSSALSGPWTTHWKAESQQRDFIFEVPDVNDQPVFLTFPRICPSGTNRRLGGGFSQYFDPSGNPSTFIQSITFGRTYRRQFFYIPVEEQIQHVDLTLRYFYGPRREADCTFIGPFEMGRAVEADGAKPYYLTFQKAYTADQSGIQLRFQTDEPFDSDTPAVLYDLSGRRYMLNGRSGSSGSSGADRKYEGVLVSPEKIAAITFGEKPHEITFKNIAVHFADRPHRTYPEFLDQMAKRLGLTGLSPKQLAEYRFKSPQEAIDVLDIVRGNQHVRHALEAIKHSRPKVEIPALDQTTKYRIRQVAGKWAGADDLRPYGIELGLMGQWPEFFDMAVARLSEQTRVADNPFEARTRAQDNASIANVMINHRLSRLTAEQIDQLKQVIRTTDSGSVQTYLLGYLERTESQAATNALWELAQDDRLWIWWPATRKWYMRSSRSQTMHDGLSERMKVRMLLVNDRFRGENLEAKALLLLKEVFTPQLGMMASQVWNEVRGRISRELDRRSATEAYIEYLRRMRSAMAVREWISGGRNSSWRVAYVIRALNVWYDMNIANLGKDPDARWSEPRTRDELIELISEALAWYDGNPGATPVELTFAGQVVDTAGNPIAGATLRFAEVQEHQDAPGIYRQRTVDVGQQTTDAAGRFSFNGYKDARHYTFDVAANGFLPRERLSVHRLADGRYRYRERATQQDDVVQLQRGSGQISGIVLGADGKPLADAELRLFAVSPYSQNDPTNSVKTNSEGKFAVEDVPSGPFLLSYADLRPMPHGVGRRTEYNGLCGAVRVQTIEGGHLDDVVLDLSKSVCSLEVEVVDEAGAPVKEIWFTLNAEMKGGSYRYAPVFRAETRSNDGVYRFGGMPPGAWSAGVSYWGHTRLDIELSLGKTARYKVVCEPRPARAEIAGTAPAASGQVKPGRSDARPGAPRIVFLPDLETPDANGVLDLASGQMLSARGSENDDRYFEKLGRGDLAYEYARNKAALICLRGATMQLRTDDGPEPLKPDLQRQSFNAYFLDEVPCRYRITTAEGAKYDVKVLSVEEGDRGRVRIEYSKAPVQVESEQTPGEAVDESGEFGQATEMAVNFDSRSTCIDLDTGTLFTYPKDFGSDRESVAIWFDNSGIDISFFASYIYDTPGLVLLAKHGLVGAPVSEAVWDSAQANVMIEAKKAEWEGMRPHLADPAMGDKGLGSGDGAGHPTFVFKTGKGNVGVLQVMEVIREEQRPRRAKIRYKMLRDSSLQVRDVDVAWGEAVEGIQCRVRFVRASFCPTEEIEFDVVYRNVSDRPITVYDGPAHFWQWIKYEARNWRGDGVLSSPIVDGLRPELKLSDFKTLQPGESTSSSHVIRRDDMGKSPLDPGRYAFKVEINRINRVNKVVYGFDDFCRKHNLEPWIGLLESGHAELVISPLPPIQWGQAKDGLQVGVNAPVAAGPSAVLLVYLQNVRSGGSPYFDSANFDVDIDGRQYVHHYWAGLNARQEVVYPGQIRGPIRLALADYVAEQDRNRARTASRPLENLVAGTHRLKITYVGRNGSPRIDSPEFSLNIRGVGADDGAFGRVVDEKGEPVAGAQVALSTAEIGVQVSHGKLKPMPGEDESRIVETDLQGIFDLAERPAGSFDLIITHDKGFAIVGSEEYLASDEIRLLPWGRIEGRVAEGRHADENKIWMSGSPNSTWCIHKREYRYEAVCDTRGYFVFEKVPAGWFEAGYLIRTGDNSWSITSRTAVEVKAGETAKITLGGSGRPVVGKFVPPEGYDKTIYFGNGLRALQTTRPDEPLPDNFDRMTGDEQQQWRKQWRKTDQYRQYRDAYWHDPNWRQYTFRIYDDGSFRIEDVIAGKYDFTVWIEERMTGAGPPEEIGSYYGTIEVPQMPGGRSDEPLDLGELVVTIHEPPVPELTGRVVDEEGEPVADAQVALSAEGMRVKISHGKLEPVPFDAARTEIVRTDAAGSFAVEERPSGPFDLIAAHDKGFARVESDDFGRSRTAQLRPWGRIEGQLASDRSAGAAHISLSILPNLHAIATRRQYNYYAASDQSGRFVFEKVPPGLFAAGYRGRNGNPTCKTPVEVKPGETSHVTIGGTGQPVVGKFVPPASYGKPLTFDQDVCLGSMTKVEPKMPLPVNYTRLSKRRQLEWQQQWLKTDEFKAFRDAHRDKNWRSYELTIDRDGTFRADDVIAGRYDFRLHLEQWDREHDQTELLAHFSGTVDVPEMPGGRSDEPLDLGALELTMNEPLSVSDETLIRRAISEFWEAIEAGDVESARRLGPVGLFAQDGLDVAVWVKQQADQKQRILNKRSRDLGEIEQVWVRNDEAVALKRSTGSFADGCIFFYVRLSNGWTLYGMDVGHVVPPLNPVRLFDIWPRTSLDNKAWSEYLQAAESLHKGMSRAELARLFSSMGRRHAVTRRGRTCAELGTLLAHMAEEDERFVEPADVQSLSLDEQIAYYVFKLRDVAEREMSTPGKCTVLRYPRTPNSPAVALHNMGRAVVPAMISLLNDRRPTRSVGLARNGGAVLRNCDVALEIIEAIAEQEFDKRSERGAFLSTANAKTAETIIAKVKQWWQDGGPTGKAQGAGRQAALLEETGSDNVTLEKAVPKARADFESFSVEISGIWRWWQKARFTVAGDGRVEFSMNKGPNDAERYKATFNLKQEHLTRLNTLLENTGWLTRPGANVQPGYTDASRIEMTVSRHGTTNSAWCHDQNPEPYGSLVKFVEQIYRQEYLLNRMSVGDESERRSAAHQIQDELKAIKGKPVAAGPTRILHYHRFVPVCMEILSDTDANNKETIRAALWLLAHVRAEDQRDLITELTTATQTASDPQLSQAKTDDTQIAAIEALVAIGGSESICHIRTLAKEYAEKNVWVNNAIVEALFKLDGLNSIDLFKSMLKKTPSAGWALIRLGEPAVPAIVEALEGMPPRPLESTGQVDLIRQYIDNWEQVRKPVDDRVIDAVRANLDYRRGSSSSWTNYHKELLTLANASEPQYPDSRQIAEQYLLAVKNGNDDLIRRITQPVQSDWHERLLQLRQLPDLEKLKIVKVHTGQVDNVAYAVCFDINDLSSYDKYVFIILNFMSGQVWRVGNIAVYDTPLLAKRMYGRFLGKNENPGNVPSPVGAEQKTDSRITADSDRRVKTSEEANKKGTDTTSRPVWGEPLNGLRMRLSAPAGTIYRRGMSLPLVLEIQNVSEQPIPLIKMSSLLSFKVTDRQNRRLGVQGYLWDHLTSWEGVTGALAPGEVISETCYLERLRLEAPLIEDSVTLHFELPTQTVLPGRLPITEYSNPVAIQIEDSPFEHLLKSEDLPEKWTDQMNIVYRERGLFLGNMAMHIDGRGRVTTIGMRLRPGAPIPDGRREYVPDRDELDELLRQLREFRIERLDEYDGKTFATDLDRVYLSLAKGGQVFSGEYEVFGSRTEPVSALQTIMRQFVARTVAEKDPDPPVSSPENSLLKAYEVEGLKFEAGFVPDKAEYVWGEPIHYFSYMVRNTGDKTMSFREGGDYRGGRSESHEITAVDANGTPVPVPEMWRMGGLVGVQKLLPGEVYTKMMPVSRRLTFGGPGVYTVTGKRTLILGESLDPIFSNEGNTDVPTGNSFQLTIHPYSNERMSKVIDGLAEQIRRLGDVVPRSIEITEPTELSEANRLHLALSSIIATREDAALEHLSSMARGGSTTLRSTAVKSLGKFKDDRALAVVLEALDDDQASIRSAAAEALGTMSTDATIDVLIERLDREQPEVAGEMLRAMGRTKSPRVFDLLVESLEHQNDTRRRAAADALVSFGSAAAVEALKTCVDDDDMNFREDVVKRLAEPLRQPIDADWLVPVVRSRKGAGGIGDAPRLLRLYAGPKAVPALLSCLDFENPSIRSYYNYAIIYSQGSCQGGLRIPWNSDLNRDGTPEEIAQNRSILRKIKAWVEHYYTHRLDEKSVPKPQYWREQEKFWGEPADGISIRVRLDQRVWPEGMPQLIVFDVRNKPGQGTMNISSAPELLEVQVNGDWYVHQPPLDEPTMGIDAGHGSSFKNVLLNEQWRRKSDDKPLVLKPGAYTLRLRLSLVPESQRTGLVMSRPIQFEVIETDQ